MHKQLKRIEDYDKNLPIVEIYTAVQSEGSRAGYPTVVIRTTGCTHRCYFGEGGWCDSWYTSIHPEKGHFNFKDIIAMYNKNPHIKEMMLTGGSPTMKTIYSLLLKLRDLIFFLPIILLIYLVLVPSLVILCPLLVLKLLRERLQMKEW